ncbi:MAG TPA: cold shock domain-containing protein [Microthrixaceae bacterium]|nr:cold shock domain-containing protein [Microthrixaceae bacterium]
MTPLEGSVTSFDDPRGLGVVTARDGDDYPFHCTAIADGTRTIDVGIEVRFEIEAGPMGRWEARRISPLG